MEVGWHDIGLSQATLEFGIQCETVVWPGRSWSPRNLRPIARQLHDLVRKCITLYNKKQPKVMYVVTDIELILSSLWDHHAVFFVSVDLALSNLECLTQPVKPSWYIYIYKTAYLPILTAYLINPWHPSVCLCVYPPVSARKQLVKILSWQQVHISNRIVGCFIFMMSIAYKRKLGN